MAMREKLDKLLNRWLGHLSLAATDDLIANGVTIQRWIPVTERLPETTGLYIISKCNVPSLAWYTGKDWRFAATATVADGVTHWMPLPEAPKAEMEKADLPNISKDTMNALNRMGANAHREENP